MEEALLNSLNPDNSIRIPSENYLRSLESTPGFLISLFKIFSTSTIPVLQLSSIILSRSVITRQWYIPQTNSKPAPVPEEEKAQVKSFLLNRVLIEKEPNPKYLEYLILCIAGITKYSFYEQWRELYDYFVLNIDSLDYIGIKLLETTVKVQVKRRMKVKQFREWITQIYSSLKLMWLSKNCFELDKIMLRSLTVIKDEETVWKMLAKMKDFLIEPDSEAKLKSFIKGISAIEKTFPEIFVLKILEIYMEILYLLVMQLDFSNSAHLILLKPAIHNLREILTTNTSAVSLLQARNFELFKRYVDTLQTEDFWEPWSNGDFKEAFESHEKSDKNKLYKLIVTLMTVYPDLLLVVQRQCENFHLIPSQNLHAMVVVITLLPKVFETVPNPGFVLEALIEKIGLVQLQSFHKKVIFKDLLTLIRKWLRFASDFLFIYQAVVNIHSSDACDLFITYEICLTLKELMNFPVSNELSISIIANFGRDVFGLLYTFTVPQMIWNIVSLVSSLIQKSASQKIPELIKCFQDIGLNELLASKAEMIVLALIDMFEAFIKIYPEESIIIQSSAFFLKCQLSSVVSEKIYYLWHFCVANIEASKENIMYMDELLPFLSNFSVLQRDLAIKILSEYVLLYKSGCRSQEEILAFVKNYCMQVSNLTGNPEYDNLSLNMLIVIGLVDLSVVSIYIEHFKFYLKTQNYDMSVNSCFSCSLFLINKLVINFKEIFCAVDLKDWVLAIGKLTQKSYQKIFCVALLKNFEGLRSCFLEFHDDIYSFILPFVENSDKDKGEDRKVAMKNITCAQLCPSVRKQVFMRLDPDANVNINQLFKQTMMSSVGQEFIMVLTAEKQYKIGELVKSTHTRSLSK